MGEQTIKSQPRRRGGKRIGKADIVLAVDVTGSMTPCINGIKANLNELVDNLVDYSTKDQSSLDWRARVMPFRDVKEDGNDAIDNSNPFVDSEGELKSQIDSMEASGGGEAPESHLDALYVAIKKSNWRPKDEAHRFVVLFTDAPPWKEIQEVTVESKEERIPHKIKQLFETESVNIFLVAPKDKEGVFEELNSSKRVIAHWIGEKGEDIYDGLANENIGAILKRIAKWSSELSSGPVKA